MRKPSSNSLVLTSPKLREWPSDGTCLAWVLVEGTKKAPHSASGQSEPHPEPVVSQAPLSSLVGTDPMATTYFIQLKLGSAAVMEVFCKSFSKEEKTTTLSILVQIELPGFYYFFDLFPRVFFFFFFKPTHPQLTMEPRFIKQRQKENKQKTNQSNNKKCYFTT